MALRPLSPRQRQIALGSALVLTLALVAWVGQEAGEEDAPAVEAPRPAGSRPPGPQAGGGTPPADTAPGLRPGRPAAAGEPGEIKDLFAGQTWERPPPPAEAAPPEAPPLPFTYLGRLVDQGQVTVYLAEEDRNLAVRQGDVINGTYRVKRISPSAVTFIYIPMNTQQTLELGRND